MTAERWAWRVLCAATVVLLAWATASMDWARVAPSSVFLLQALGTSWLLALVSMVTGGLAAVPLAGLRVYGGRWLSPVATVLIEAVRVTPELMIVFWVYFAGPVLSGSRVTAWSAALWALGLIAASHLAEVIRGGLLSVPSGQSEGAAALGLTWLQAFRLVVLPQALRNMAPALMAQFVGLFKTTSLVYAIGVMEFFRAVSVTNNAIYDPYPLYTLLAAGYFVSCWAVTRVIRWLDPAYEVVE
jgi:polar amino acid transport system permease protein